LVIKIDFKNGINNALITKKVISDEWQNIYHKLIINYDNISIGSQKLSKASTINTTPPDYDYLIIV
jgi:hypothetical protein